MPARVSFGQNIMWLPIHVVPRGEAAFLPESCGVPFVKCDAFSFLVTGLVFRLQSSCLLLIATPCTLEAGHSSLGKACVCVNICLEGNSSFVARSCDKLHALLHMLLLYRVAFATKALLISWDGLMAREFHQHSRY